MWVYVRVNSHGRADRFSSSSILRGKLFVQINLVNKRSRNWKNEVNVRGGGWNQIWVITLPKSGPHTYYVVSVIFISLKCYICAHVGWNLSNTDAHAYSCDICFLRFGLGIWQICLFVMHAQAMQIHSVPALQLWECSLLSPTNGKLWTTPPAN